MIDDFDPRPEPLTWADRVYIAVSILLALGGVTLVVRALVWILARV